MEVSEDRWNLAHDRAEAVAFGAEFGIEPLVVGLVRHEEPLNERPLAGKKALRIGMPRITPMREETFAGPGTPPEETPVLQPRPVVGEEIGVELPSAFGTPLQKRRAHEGIRPGSRASS